MQKAARTGGSKCSVNRGPPVGTLERVLNGPWLPVCQRSPNQNLHTPANGRAWRNRFVLHTNEKWFCLLCRTKNEASLCLNIWFFPTINHKMPHWIESLFSPEIPNITTDSAGYIQEIFGGRTSLSFFNEEHYAKLCFFCFFFRSSISWVMVSDCWSTCNRSGMYRSSITLFFFTARFEDEPKGKILAKRCLVSFCLEIQTTARPLF